MPVSQIGEGRRWCVGEGERHARILIMQHLQTVMLHLSHTRRKVLLPLLPVLMGGDELLTALVELLQSHLMVIGNVIRR